MSLNGKQTNSSGTGFWKIHHVAIGIAILLMIVFVVRSCGSESGDEGVDAGDGDAIPRQTVVVEIPATQWQGQRSPVVQQAYPVAPAYPAQQPVYGYPAQPPVQQQPAYQVDPGNPWAVQRQQPLYGGSFQPAPQQAPGWGQPQPQRPAYPQNQGGSQFRPLDESRAATREQRAPVPASSMPRAVAPYDRLSGSSYGENGGAQGAWPYAGTYPGYYGGTPYGGTPYGRTPYGGVPGAYPPVAPGMVYPRLPYTGVW